jgi:membrane-bound metal-dependent hydrolase YbcI (DUF457 family)
MMGWDHGLSGIVVGTATLPAVAALLHPAPSGLALYLIATTGAALLNDIDHPGSGMSRCLGPATRTLAWCVAKLSGGHRNGTHSYWGVGNFTLLTAGGAAAYQHSLADLLFGILAWLVLGALGTLHGLHDRTLGKDKTPARTPARDAVTVARGTTYVTLVCGLTTLCVLYGAAAGQWIVGVVILLTMAAPIRLLRIRGYWDDIAPIPITIWIIYEHIDVTTVPVAVAVGTLVHIAGDMVTYGGCPIGWPLSQRNISLHWFKTNSDFEHDRVTPALILSVFAATAFAFWAMTS